jgi:hypothetical protein
MALMYIADMKRNPLFRRGWGNSRHQRVHANLVTGLAAGVVSARRTTP